MATCKNCGMTWAFDYAPDICGPFCDGVLSQKKRIKELEVERDEWKAVAESKEKSYCTHCRKLFPKGAEGVAQFKAHIAECNAHPLQPLAKENQRLAAELAEARRRAEILRAELLRVQGVVGEDDSDLIDVAIEAATAAGGEK